ncbi:MAG: AraC family transcriptional regulator [Paludibacteraceae bacterium]|nr:AraC family transcriptional regulator [Paludibacteraceae bacterium]
MKIFFGLIHRHYKEHRNLAYYADKLCVSTRYLSSVTNIISGCSPKKLIDDYIILEIKIQLQSTNYTVQEISQRLNFSDQSVMGRFFKQQTGLGAMEYRKSLR